MQTLDVRGFIARDSATRRYVVTDTGRAVLGVLLERGIKLNASDHSHSRPGSPRWRLLSAEHL